MREDRRGVGHSCRQQFLSQRDEPVNAGVAGASDHGFDARPDVVDGSEILQVADGAVHRTADSHQAARTWRRLRRMQAAPDGRRHAVGADQQVPFDRFTAPEAQSDAIARLREALGLVINRDVVEADGIEQRSVQRWSQRDGERAADHGADRKVDALDHGAVHSPHFDDGANRRERAGQDGVRDAEVRQRSNGVGCDRQAEPQFARRRGPLEHRGPASRPGASAIAADSPPMPAPTINAVRATGALQSVRRAMRSIVRDAMTRYSRA